MNYLKRRTRALALVGATVLIGTSSFALSTASSATTVVTNPAKAIIVNGRFTTTVVLDGGVITVTPAPKATVSTRGFAAVKAEIWASAQLQGFRAETVGFGIVTVTVTSKAVQTIAQIPAWVGFANGNITKVCLTHGKKIKSFHSNGEAAVVIGDATGSPAAAYVPPGCGLTQRSGVTVPTEVTSEPWTLVGSVSATGLTHFRFTAPSCAAVGGIADASAAGQTTVKLIADINLQTVANCAPTSFTLPLKIRSKTTNGATFRLIHGPTGAIRQVA
jgi:hypothetical protein